MSVADIFKTFCNELIISTPKRSLIAGRHDAICKRLNLDFWNMNTTSGRRYVGSMEDILQMTVSETLTCCLKCHGVLIQNMTHILQMSNLHFCKL